MANVPLRRLILQTVLELGEADVTTVLARVGKYISASQAVTAGQHVVRGARKRKDRRKRYQYQPSTGHLTRLGRRRLVRDALCRLYKRGELERVRSGVYRAPRPKLHTPTDVPPPQIA